MKRICSPRWLLSPVMVACVFCTSVLFAADEPTPGKQVTQHFVSAALPEQNFGYLLFLPKNYGKDNRKWPVMMFLHGSGERGDDALAGASG